MLTPLENAVIEALLERTGEPFDIIRQQLAHALVTERRFTGVGFFTNFAVATDAPVRRDLPDMTFGDVGAEFPGLQHGAGFLLFVRDGVVCMLEGFTYDEKWPMNADKFRVYRHEVTEVNGAAANSPTI